MCLRKLVYASYMHLDVNYSFWRLRNAASIDSSVDKLKETQIETAKAFPKNFISSSTHFLAKSLSAK